MWQVTLCSDQHYNDRDFPSDNYSKVDHVIQCSSVVTVAIVTGSSAGSATVCNRLVK